MTFQKIDLVTVGHLAQNVADAAKTAYWTEAGVRQLHVDEILSQFENLASLVAQLRADQDAVQEV